jgi:hypothetical protein
MMHKKLCIYPALSFFKLAIRETAWHGGGPLQLAAGCPPLPLVFVGSGANESFVFRNDRQHPLQAANAKSSV